MTVTVQQPHVDGNLTDGRFSGLAHGSTGAPGKVLGYDPNAKYYNVPSVTAQNTGVSSTPVQHNKLLLYVNGIGTPRATHAYTVKLLSVVSGAKVIGIYNQSGDGDGTNLFNDLIQCLGDKTGLSNNPATNTLTRSAYTACIESKYLNIVAHSQGAIITSRAMRQTKGKLLDYYGRRDSVVRPLLEQFDRIANRSMLQRILSSANPITNVSDSTLILRLRSALAERINPSVERLMNNSISAQTFGGAARFFPDGPRYRHIYNSWDPVPMAVGQGDIMTGPGSGATVNQLSRNSGSRFPDIADHSITDVYLQSSGNYVDRQGKRVDSSYIPIDMSMVR